MKVRPMKRYNDGAFDYIIKKLSNAYDKFKAMFGGLPTGRKILLLIGKAMQLFGIASGATNVVTLLSVQKKVQAIRALLNGAAWSIPIPVIGTAFGKIAGGLVNAIGNRFEKHMTGPLFKKIIEDILTVGLGVITQKIAEYGPETKTKAKEFIGKFRGKKDSAMLYYRDSLVRRYNDFSLQSLFESLKARVKGFIAQFKAFRPAKKFLFILAKLIKIGSLILQGVGAKGMYDAVKGWKNTVDEAKSEYSKQEQIFETIGPNAQKDLTTSGLSFKQTTTQMQFMFAGMKIILGICGVMTGVFLDKLNERIK